MSRLLFLPVLMEAPNRLNRDQRVMRVRFRALIPYATAFLLTVGTVAVRAALERGLHDDMPMLLLVLPIFISSQIGGIGPGLLATVLASLAGCYFLEPRHVFWVQQPPDQIRLVMFLFVGILISVLTERLRRLRFQEQSHLARLGAIEERFRVHDERLRVMATVVESSPNFIGLCTPDLKPFYVNTAGRTMVGLDQQEVEYKALVDYFCPEDRARIESEAIPKLRTDGCWSGEIRLRHFSTGRHIDTIWAPFPIKDDAGTTIAWAFISPDLTHVKRAQEALRDSEEKFRAIFERAAIGMARVSFTDARWIDVNEAFCRMLGYTAEEMRATPWPQITHPDDVDLDLIPFRRMAGGELDAYTVEKRFVHKQGHHVSARLTLSLVRDSQGQPGYEIAIIEDITRRKQAEEQLARSEERYRLLNRATHDVIWDWDLLADRLEWNDAVLDTFGYRVEEMGRTIESWYSRVHPDDRDRVHASVKAAIHRRDQTWTGEYRFRRKNGEYSHVLDRGFIARDQAGQGYRMIGSMIDLTERRKLETALRESEAQFRQLADAIPQLVWITDPDGKQVYLNHRWREYTGATSAHLQDGGRDVGWAHTLHPDDYHRTLERWRECLKTGEPYEIEYRFRRNSDGSYRWFLARATPVRDEQGKIAKWFGTSTEIHEQKETQAALEESRRQLAGARTAAEQARHAAEEASAAKDRFLAVLSHELRTPLTPVLASVSMLQKNPFLDDRTQHNLEMIRRNIELEARLIDDLLDLTRIARGKIELYRQPIDLCTVINRAVDVCRPDLEARGLQFEMNIEPGAPCTVEVDVARLQQVFWNLLKNSIKFTAHGGRVEVRVRREEGWAVTDFIDNGVGIEPAAMPRIFDAFAQADQAVTRQFGGLGLGLAISRSLVELHGGTIEAHSPGKGQGSTFQVRLPLQSSPAGATTPQLGSAAASLPIRQSRILRILVVEDHGDTAEMLQLMLEAEGHEVETAGDVAGGLEAVGQNHFDLLISDLGLPDGSGMDLMRELRSRGYQGPAIVLSGYGQESDIQETRAAGFAAHIVKPIDMDRLVQALYRLVR